MQAVILAGGLGTRLWPLTTERPKPMVAVGGRPFLEHQLLLLKRQAITDVVLLIGYCGQQISEYFGDGERLGLSIQHSVEQKPLGTAGALRQARGLLEETFLVLYGDSYLPIEYRPVHDVLTQSSAVGVLVVYDNCLADTSVTNNVALDSSGYVTRYDKAFDAAPGLSHVEAGALAFRRGVLDCIPGHGVASLEGDVFPVLAQRRQLLGYVTSQRFYDIGTPERLRVIDRLLSHDHHTDPVSH